MHGYASTIPAGPEGPGDTLAPVRRLIALLARFASAMLLRRLEVTATVQLLVLVAAVAVVNMARPLILVPNLDEDTP